MSCGVFRSTWRDRAPPPVCGREKGSSVVTGLRPSNGGHNNDVFGSIDHSHRQCEHAAVRVGSCSARVMRLFAPCSLGTNNHCITNHPPTIAAVRAPTIPLLVTPQPLQQFRAPTITLLVTPQPLHQFRAPTIVSLGCLRRIRLGWVRLGWVSCGMFPV